MVTIILGALESSTVYSFRNEHMTPGIICSLFFSATFLPLVFGKRSSAISVETVPSFYKIVTRTVINLRILSVQDVYRRGWVSFDNFELGRTYPFRTRSTLESICQRLKDFAMGRKYGHRSLSRKYLMHRESNTKRCTHLHSRSEVTEEPSGIDLHLLPSY